MCERPVRRETGSARRRSRRSAPSSARRARRRPRRTMSRRARREHGGTRRTTKQKACGHHGDDDRGGVNERGRARVGEQNKFLPGVRAGSKCAPEPGPEPRADAGHSDASVRRSVRSRPKSNCACPISAHASGHIGKRAVAKRDSCKRCAMRGRRHAAVLRRQRSTAQRYTSLFFQEVLASARAHVCARRPAARACGIAATQQGDRRSGKQPSRRRPVAQENRRSRRRLRDFRR